jgi:peptide/nickel transport system permease protein
MYVQYMSWLWSVLRGDLGTSLWYKTPVWHQLKDRFLVSMELAVMAILLAFVVAVPLGVTSAVKQDTGFDYLSRVFCGIGVALPTFWSGILIVYALASFFQWLPPLGYATVWDDPLTNLEQLIFPALTLAFADLAFTARVTRSSMLEVMREDYVRTARGKGLREIAVIGRHALKNALLPVVTVSGYQFGRLLGGVIIVESIFVVPGMGTLLIDSIIHRDFIVLQAIVLLIAAVVLVLNLVIDLLYGVLDPRIRYR